MTIDTAREERIIDAVESLLDAATERHYDRTSDDTIIECHVCGDWDGHNDGCFVPALLKWQNAPKGIA